MGTRPDTRPFGVTLWKDREQPWLSDQDICIGLINLHDEDNEQRCMTCRDPWPCSTFVAAERLVFARGREYQLRRWLEAIGNLADVDADNRGWMMRDALAGLSAPADVSE